MTAGRTVRLALAVLVLSGPLASPGQEFQQLLIKKGTLQGDQYLAASTVDVHGTVVGDLTMAGLQAGLDGTVSGDVNAVGVLVHVGGVVGDDVRALGGQVIVQGWVHDALLAGGGEISLTPGTRVGGKAILGGRRIVIRGDLGATLDATGSYVEIDGDVEGTARIRSDEVVIGPKARLRGDLVVLGANPPRIADGAKVGGKVTVEAAPPATLGAWIVAASRAALMQIGMLLVAWAWMALAPLLARDAAAIEWRSPGLAETMGLAAVAGLPLVALLAALTVVGIPIAIGVASAWVLLVLVGYSSTAIFLGAWLRARTRRTLGVPGMRSRLLWTLIALLLLRAASALPWAGWVVTVGAVLAGAGAVARAAQLARARRSIRGAASAAGILLCIAAAAPATAADPGLPQGTAAALTSVSPAALSAGTRFLSSDLLEGRGTGTRGHELAALWVATQMQAVGLEPAAGEGRWEQAVPLRAWRIDPEASALAVHGPGLPPLRLVRDQDFVALSDGESAEVELDGAMAFVGHAISAPEYGYDDMKGVDLTGKIAVVLLGAPTSDRPDFFPPAPGAVYADRLGKMRRLAARGAAGVILVYTPDSEKSLPWEAFARNTRMEGMGWTEGTRLGDGVGGLPARAVVSMRGFEKLAAAAGVAGGARGILEKAEANRLVAEDWPVKARIRSAAEVRTTRSVNVLGILRGSDPVLARETVVVTAHLDHLGIGVPVDGDAIYNGAADNAVGVAVLLEVARAFAALPRRPARSVLFAAVTGEEKGLVGSSFLATHPVVDAGGIVADINIDGAPTASSFEVAVARGAEHSTLAAAARRAADSLGVELVPDPAPRAGVFVRSDQWSFVRVGVPSLHLAPRRKPGTGEGRCHSPKDEWDEAWLWEDTARFARLQFLVALLVAEGSDRPSWNQGDFFERFVQPPRPARR
jgi:cytoskeletal protein CcmA (bactofilin family)